MGVNTCFECAHFPSDQMACEDVIKCPLVCHWCGDDGWIWRAETKGMVKLCQSCAQIWEEAEGRV